MHYTVRGEGFDFQQVCANGYIYTLSIHGHMIPYYVIIRKVMMEELLTGHLL